jgi:uncharacterized membrane protein YjjP (DUF1212 family)
MLTVVAPSVSLNDSNLDPLEDSLLLSSVDQYDDPSTVLKKFLFRLLIELHDAGTLSFKSEEYFQKVARAYNLHASCVISPTSALIYFQRSHHLSPTSSETYTIRIRNGLNFSKLEKLDTLCWMICGKNKLTLDEALVELKNITAAPPMSVFITLCLSVVYLSCSFSALFI